jgi:hypothetical protein
MLDDCILIAITLVEGQTDTLLALEVIDDPTFSMGATLLSLNQITIHLCEAVTPHLRIGDSLGILFR